MRTLSAFLIVVTSFSAFARVDSTLIDSIRNEDTPDLKAWLSGLDEARALSLLSMNTVRETQGFKEKVRTLEWAAAEGKVKSLAVLLDYVAKKPLLVEKLLNGNVIGLSLLHIAIKEDQIESALMILDFPDAATKNKMVTGKRGVLPALVYAAQRGQIDVVSKILEIAHDRQFITLIASPDPQNALYYAAYHGHIDVIRALMESRFSVLFMSQAKLYLNVSELEEELRRETWSTLVEYEPMLAFQSAKGLRDIGQHEAAHIYFNAKLVRDCWDNNIPYNHTLFRMMMSHRKDFNETRYLEFLIELDPFKAYAWFYILKGCNRILRFFSLPEFEESQ